MATVTFYKTKMNRSNRAYDGAALDSILTAASALTVNITPEVIPDTPFAIISANNNNITASDIVLGGYDYISYSYGGKTWYAFIDDVQALATSVGNFFVYHTVDKWAMCVKYFTSTFHMQGAVERAHVNDCVVKSGTNAAIDMSFTTGTPEAPYNKMLVKEVIPEVVEPLAGNDYYFVYIYISNPREITSSATGQALSAPQIYDIAGKKADNMGVTLCYPAYFDSEDFYIICNNLNQQVSTYNVKNIQRVRLASITAQAISGITISKYTPVDEINSLVTKTATEADDIGFVGSFPYWSDIVLSKYHYSSVLPENAGGLPSALNWFYTVTGLSNFSQNNIISGDAVADIVKAIDFETYMKRIPKMLSTIYNPRYIDNNLVGVQANSKFINIGGIVYNDVFVCYSPDLTYLIIALNEDNSFRTGVSRFIYVKNKALFAPEATIDYWTKLNAEQSTIGANKEIFNAIAGAVFSPIKGALAGGIAGTMTQGKNQSSANFGFGVAGAAVGAASGVVGGIGNAVYAIQSANNMQEIADRQYNCGETNKWASTGSYKIFANDTEACGKYYSCENQFDVIAPNLHRMGYNTFLQIDEIYANHKRKYFNYFKGADVSVSGMPQNWSEDIENMFNNGVTLWQSDVENYERLNYPQNTGW